MLQEAGEQEEAAAEKVSSKASEERDVLQEEAVEYQPQHEVHEDDVEEEEEEHEEEHEEREVDAGDRPELAEADEDHLLQPPLDEEDADKEDEEEKESRVQQQQVRAAVPPAARLKPAKQQQQQQAQRGSAARPARCSPRNEEEQALLSTDRRGATKYAKGAIAAPSHKGNKGAQAKVQRRPAAQVVARRTANSYRKGFRLPCSSPMMIAIGAMLGVVFVGKLGQAGVNVLDMMRVPTWLSTSLVRQATEPPLCAARLFDGIVQLQEGKVPMEPAEDKPVILLKAPCVYTAFNSAVKKYRPTGWWHYQETTAEQGATLELIHRHEPSIVLNVAGGAKGDTVVDFLQENILPLFGRLNNITYEWYLSQGVGLIWALFEGEQARAAVRPQLLEVGKKFRNKHLATYVEVEENKEWLESELGITTFPAIVVQRSAGGRPHVYRGPMTSAGIGQFIADVDDGCLHYEPWRHLLWDRREELGLEAKMCSLIPSSG